MINYFSIFPKNFYNLNDNNSYSIVTNVLTRFTIENNTKDNTVMYFKYDIKENETPEILSSKIYGTPFNHWLILILNNIVDIENQWPLDGKQFERYLNSKYKEKDLTKTGSVWAQQNTHSYYKVRTARVGIEKAKVDKFQVDANTYASIVQSNNNQFTLPDGNVYRYDITKETKNYYTFESEENEKKRSIKLLKREFVAPLEEQIKLLMSGRK